MFDWLMGFLLTPPASMTRTDARFDHLENQIKLSEVLFNEW